jgi:hypothetical protein
MLWGLTYEPGEYEVDEKTGRKLLHNFPNVCSEVDLPRADGVGGYVTADYELFEPGGEAVVPKLAELDASVVYEEGDDPVVTKIMVKELDKDSPNLLALADLLDHGITDKAYKLAQELHAEGRLTVPLSKIVGTGKGGKILVRDVQKVASQ